MSTASCPSCGAPVEFRNKASLWVVCEHCTTMSVRRDLNLETVGKVAALKEDGSPVQLGTRGNYRGKRFEVVGRIQLQYGRGYWNEWFLDFEDGTNGWLGEAQGDYAVSFVREAGGALPAFASLSPGMSVKVAGAAWEVQDIESARCVSGQGELPFGFEGGYEAPVVDLSGADGKFATLDYSEQPPLVFVGEWLDFDALGFADLREVEDW